MITAAPTAMPADSVIACRNVDPDLFHTWHRGSTTIQVDAARSFCHRCPSLSRVSCRDFALSQPKQYRQGLIAGGWYWPVRGNPVPFPGDEALAAELLAGARP